MPEVIESLYPNNPPDFSERVNNRGITQEQFESIVHSNYEQYLNFARSQLPYNSLAQSDASSVVQEALIKVFTNLDKIKGDTRSLNSFIHQAIKTTITDLWRRANAKKRSGGSDGRFDSNKYYDALANIPSPEPNALDNLLMNDLIKVINTLPSMYRDILLLEIDEPDMPGEDKARKLGLKLNTYKSRLYRARNLLEEKGYKNWHGRLKNPPQL